MQAQSPCRHRLRRRHRTRRRRSRRAGTPPPASRLRGLQDHPPQRRGGRLRAGQDRGRDDEGVPRGARHAGRGLGARARDGRRPDRGGGARAAAPRRAAAPSISRTSRTRSSWPDARRRARRRPRLRAVPRAARAGARQAARSAEPAAGAGAARHRRRRSACRSTSRALQALVESACEGLGDDVERRADPRRDAAQPVRRRADRRGVQGGDPGRAHADREGPGLQLRHRAPAAAHDPPRGARRGSDAGRDGARATPTTSRSSSSSGIEAELLDERLAQFDLEPPRRGARSADRDLQFNYLGLQTLYDRYFLHIDEAPHRAAAGVLHARGDGPGAERDRPRSARDRVLRRAVELRLHELDADAVQLRHAALAAVVAAT